jgi:hypothetical protein
MKIAYRSSATRPSANRLVILYYQSKDCPKAAEKCFCKEDICPYHLIQDLQDLTAKLYGASGLTKHFFESHQRKIIMWPSNSTKFMLVVSLWSVLEPEAETGRIFYSPPRPAPKKISPASPAPKKISPASPRPEKSFPRLAPPRKKFPPPRPAPPLVFILHPRPASPRKKLSPPRPAPLFQGISINGIDTKGRNGEGFLLPASPRPVSIFYFSSPPCPAKSGSRPVSVSDSDVMVWPDLEETVLHVH